MVDEIIIKAPNFLQGFLRKGGLLMIFMSNKREGRLGSSEEEEEEEEEEGDGGLSMSPSILDEEPWST